MNTIEIIESLDWEDASQTAPSNGVSCIAQLADGSYVFDVQYFGEWRNMDVIRWALVDPDELLNKLIQG